MALTPHEIRIRFAAPKADAERSAIKAQISEAAEHLALLINQPVPGCREESQAIKNVEIAVQWAHAAVDRRTVLRGEHRAPDGVHRLETCACGHPQHAPDPRPAETRLTITASRELP